jgi:hypothetical protein
MAKVGYRLAEIEKKAEELEDFIGQYDNDRILWDMNFAESVLNRVDDLLNLILNDKETKNG